MIIIAICFTSCRGYLWRCVEGNGTIETEYRDLEDFDEITVAGDYDVYITQGNEYEIIIQADENLLSLIVTDVRGDELKIKNLENRCLDATGSVKVFITLPEVKQLKLTGSGLIICDSLDADELEVELIGSGDIELGYGDNYIFVKDEIKIKNTGSGDIFVDLETDNLEVELIGSGDIKIEGNAEESNLYIAGSGDIDADEMVSDRCDAKIVGSGDMSVNVMDVLYVKITGSGDLFYKGHPRIFEDITGSGDIKNNN